LQIDLDGPKALIFLNTVFLNNLSINKKLGIDSNNHNPDNFSFEFSKIFSRKALKKIKSNVISKLAKLVAAKLIMKFCLPDSDDLMFIALLGFH
jgi:hypothetical protein